LLLVVVFNHEIYFGDNVVIPAKFFLILVFGFVCVVLTKESKTYTNGVGETGFPHVED
jgi:hypothetical protein